jgi:hypothetical protein
MNVPTYIDIEYILLYYVLSYIIIYDVHTFQTTDDINIYYYQDIKIPFSLFYFHCCVMTYRAWNA